MVKRLLQTVNRALPGLKRVIPTALKRRLIWHFVGGKTDYLAKRELPSRQLLEAEILPWLCKAKRSVLFVGAAAYTYPYYRAFESAGVRFVTIDCSLSAQVWGAKEHLTGSVFDIDTLVRAATFDAVICNGVFGFGVNGDQDINRALVSFARLLRCSGVLVLGWNSDVLADPLHLEQIANLYKPDASIPFPPRMAFAGETHVYDLLLLKEVKHV